MKKGVFSVSVISEKLIHQFPGIYCRVVIPIDVRSLSIIIKFYFTFFKERKVQKSQLLMQNKSKDVKDRLGRKAS